jgi:hypothetical protein
LRLVTASVTLGQLAHILDLLSASHEPRGIKAEIDGDAHPTHLHRALELDAWTEARLPRSYTDK